MTARSDRPDGDINSNQTRRLGDYVYATLRERLLTGSMAPGARINVAALGSEMHVSNTPIRYALARLAEDGIVTQEEGRGFKVSTLCDRRGAAEFYDYRMLLEPIVASRAARRRDAQAISALYEVCEQSEIARIGATADAKSALVRRDIEFHQLLATHAGNTLIVDELLRNLFRKMRYNVYPAPAVATQTWVEHRAIVDAIASADPAGAADAMREHLAGGLKRVLAVTAPFPS